MSKKTAQQLAARQTIRLLVATGMSHEQTAAYVAALINAGPLTPSAPLWVSKAFVTGLPAYAAEIPEMILATAELVNEVELDHVVGIAP